MDKVLIRTIRQEDNRILADIIRSALAEFNANKPGTVYFDKTTDHLFELFQTKRSVYHVAAMNGRVIGGAGIYPTAGLDAATCELVKIYLSPAARGKGVGKMLLEECFTSAKTAGYQRMYLETMPELIVAVPMYEKYGFTYLNGSMGNSGHNGCDIWMIKEL